MLMFPNKDSKNKTVSYNNVVRDDILKFALEVHNEIINVSTTYNGKIITLRDICVMVNNQCLYANALEVFNYNINKINDSGAVLKTVYTDISKVLHGGKNLMSLMPEIFGRFNVSSDKLTATAIRFVYRTHWGKTLELYKRNIAISKVMEDVYRKYKTIADNKGFQLQYETERTVGDAADKKQWWKCFPWCYCYYVNVDSLFGADNAITRSRWWTFSHNYSWNFLCNNRNRRSLRTFCVVRPTLCCLFRTFTISCISSWC